MVEDAKNSLTGVEILTQPWDSTLTLPDALARPSVIAAAVDPDAAAPGKVVIRKHGPEPSVEIQTTGAVPRSFIKSVEAVVGLLNLPPGWNSYSAKPIALQNVIRAICILAEILEPAAPAPS